MAHSIRNALLEETKNKVESKLPEALKQSVDATVRAGMKLLYSPETHDRLVQPIYNTLKTNGFKPEEIANGMVNLLATVGKASQGKMPIEAAFPAGVILLCYVLDDLEQTKGLTVTKALIMQIGSAMTKQFVKTLGASRSGAQNPAQSPQAAPAEPPGLAGTAPPPGAQGAM